MKRFPELSSVEQVVDAFGGPKEAADWAALGQSAISNWLARGFIPPGWHFRIDEEMRRRGFVVLPECFGAPARARPKRKAEQRVA